ncbi:MAG: iron-containing alcohol dehydrogenase, partial [Vulcanimicrobiaceae bacterium]
MICCQGYPFVDGGETAFEVDSARIKYGSGALSEVGAEARALGMKRVALFTDAQVAKLEPVATTRAALRAAGLDAVVYDAVRVEPTDASFQA